MAFLDPPEEAKGKPLEFMKSKGGLSRGDK